VTNVKFYFNAADKLGYACRMLRKAARSDMKVAVTAEPSLLRELDTLLWTFEPIEFVPHCAAGAPPAVLDATPIVLCEAARAAPHHELLVNLGASVPEGFERFERLFEVVSQEDDDRQIGRKRWQHYKSRGYEVTGIDVVTMQEV
jgi:DNA polymerase III subunit chi